MLWLKYVRRRGMARQHAGEEGGGGLAPALLDWRQEAPFPTNQLFCPSPLLPGTFTPLSLLSVH